MCSLSELRYLTTVYLFSCHSEVIAERERGEGGRESEILVRVKS